MRFTQVFITVSICVGLQGCSTDRNLSEMNKNTHTIAQETNKANDTASKLEGELEETKKELQIANQHLKNYDAYLATLTKELTKLAEAVVSLEAMGKDMMAALKQMFAPGDPSPGTDIDDILRGGGTESGAPLVDPLNPKDNSLFKENSA